jgi:hypothetical protein
MIHLFPSQLILLKKVLNLEGGVYFQAEILVKTIVVFNLFLLFFKLFDLVITKNDFELSLFSNF